MPTISTFYGIIIVMYLRNKEHSGEGIYLKLPKRTGGNVGDRKI